ALLFIILLLVALAVVAVYLNRVVPFESGKLEAPGIADSVEVFYDNYGVPHIYAQNDTDAYFALGFATARERLFQMELLRRVGSGRLSEVFGKDLVATDAFFKTLGIEEMARKHAAAFMTQMNGDWQRKARAYIDGINYFISTGPTPPEFVALGIQPDRFTPIDMYLISGYMALNFSEALRIDPVLHRISKLGPDYLAKVCADCDSSAVGSLNSVKADAGEGFVRHMERTLASLPVKVWTGSNAWVISPKRSSSQGVLFANDTHIGYQQPAVWFEAHLNFPGADIYGKYIAGMPFPLVAHNGAISYGVTIFENDDVQLYLEQQTADGKYMHRDSAKTFITRQETIRVKGVADTTFTVRETVHGPIVTDVVGQIDSLGLGPVSFWWVFLQKPNTAFETSYEMAYAKDMAAFKRAASLLNAPGLNIAYGDTSGNYAVFAGVLLPKYPFPGSTKLIVDGASGKYDVVDYLPFETNPHRINPPVGFVFSANESLDTVFNTMPGYYPPFDRANRIQQLLSEDSSVTVQDMARWMMDDVSVPHRNNARLLQNVLEPLLKGNATPDELFGLFLLASWDGSHSLDDPAPSLYYLTLSGVTEKMMLDELGETMFEAFRNTHQMKLSYTALLSDANSPWWDDVTTAAFKESRDEVVLASFRESVRYLSGRFSNRSGWAWGNMHSLEHQHALGQLAPLNHLFNVGPYAVRGGLETINNMAFHMGSNKQFEVKYGPAMRTIVDLSKKEEAISVLPTGQSGHVLSRHYDDQAKLLANGFFRPMLTNKKAIAKQAEDKLLFVPRK
ncbi:MAG: penicillin acylase family protein, partial [Bacteroidota bacterium]